MNVQTLPPKDGKFNLESYEEAAKNFDWSEAEKNFSWSDTGKVNLAHEAIDRYADSPDKKDQVALYYSDANRDEKYTSPK